MLLQRLLFGTAFEISVAKIFRKNSRNDLISVSLESWRRNRKPLQKLWCVRFCGERSPWFNELLGLICRSLTLCFQQCFWHNVEKCWFDSILFVLLLLIIHIVSKKYVWFNFTFNILHFFVESQVETGFTDRNIFTICNYTRRLYTVFLWHFPTFSTAFLRLSSDFFKKKSHR